MTDGTSASTRRRFLAAATGGLATALGAGCGGVDDRWVRVDVPTDATLTDVVATAGGIVAVGEDGTVLERGGDREGWSIALEGGPLGEENGLRTVDATSNGRVVWFGGDGGALGAYDTVTGEPLSASRPEGATSSIEAVGVSGLAGRERLFVVDSSGVFRRGHREGDALEWTVDEGFGTGASVTGFDVTGLGYAYAIDSTGDVYESVDAGREWMRIGIDRASVNFADISGIDSGHADVAGGNGVVYRYDGGAWSRTTLGEQPIAAIARSTNDALAIDAAGAIYERTFDGWIERERVEPGTEPLAITLGTARTPQTIVGESGLVLERRY